MSVSDRLTEKLHAAFAPSHLEIVDESYLHAGHAGAPDGGESHFRVKITADAFSGLSRVARHRAINTVLADELAGPVHALRLEVRSPDEV